MDCTPSQLLTQDKLDDFFRIRPHYEGPGAVYIPRLFAAPFRPPIGNPLWVKYLGLPRPNN